MWARSRGDARSPVAGATLRRATSGTPGAPSRSRLGAIAIRSRDIHRTSSGVTRAAVRTGEVRRAAFIRAVRMRDPRAGDRMINGTAAKTAGAGGPQRTRRVSATRRRVHLQRRSGMTRTRVASVRTEPPRRPASAEGAEKPHERRSGDPVGERISRSSAVPSPGPVGRIDSARGLFLQRQPVGRIGPPKRR
jgi:hypothetical protein